MAKIRKDMTAEATAGFHSPPSIGKAVFLPTIQTASNGSEDRKLPNIS